MFSKTKFMKAVRNAGLSLEAVSYELGINISTLYRKLNGESDFYRLEIYKICKILDIKDPMSIFFAE